MTTSEKKKVIDRTSSPSAGEEAGHVALTHDDAEELNMLGYRPELKRNRSMFTLLFQSLAIAAVRQAYPSFKVCITKLMNTA